MYLKGRISIQLAMDNNIDEHIISVMLKNRYFYAQWNGVFSSCRHQSLRGNTKAVSHEVCGHHNEDGVAQRMKRIFIME